MIHLLSYLFQYRPQDMAALLRNTKTPPLPCRESLKGKLVVLTGATSGIGRETALLFAEQGAELVCLNRSAEKSALLEAEIRQRFQTKLTTILCDFSSLQDVRRAVAELQRLGKPIDVLIPNAGVYYTERTFTDDGIEMVFQVNHLSAFLLVFLLREQLLAENRARILFVNSEGHRFALAGVHERDLAWKWHRYTGLKSYGAAKTAQLLTMLEFADFFRSSAVTINAMHPGNVRSAIGEHNGPRYRQFKERYILKSALEPVVSAQALHYLAAAPELVGVSGRFFHLTSEEKPAPHALDRREAAQVWQKSLELCGLA